MAPDVGLREDTARGFTHSVLVEAGFTVADAEACSDLMIDSSLRGVDSHGFVALLPTYISQARSGIGREGSQPVVGEGDRPVVVVNGGGASGPRTARIAAREAERRARAYGVGVVVASGIGYLGALGWIVHPVAIEGLIALATCNAMAFVAPHGGRTALHGTNPIAAAIPATPDPIVVDMRTNAFAMADYWAAVAGGRSLPEGLLVDTSGHPVTDPVKLERDGWETAVSLPLAGARGYGLALLVDALTAGLAGEAIGMEVSEETEHGGLGLFVLALDPEAFGPRQRFLDSIGRLGAQVRTVEPVDPAQPARLPGERGAAERRRRQQRGIPVDPMLWGGLLRRLETLRITTPHVDLEELP